MSCSIEIKTSAIHPASIQIRLTCRSWDSIELKNNLLVEVDVWLDKEQTAHELRSFLIDGITSWLAGANKD